VTKLIKIRKDHEATRSGTRATIVSNTNVWAYTVTAGSDKLYVVVNRGDATESVTLGASNLTELLDNPAGAVVGPVVSVPARQTRIYKP
jgi:glycosidase